MLHEAYSCIVFDSYMCIVLSVQKEPSHYTGL